MQTIKNLVIDLQNKSVAPVVQAVQGDNLSRVVDVSLYQSGDAWEIPSGAFVSIAYKKPDGTKGWYDTLPDMSPAVEILSKNKVRLTFALQVLSVPGKVTALVRIQSGASSLSTFPFIIEVTEDPSFGKELSNDYYNVTNWDELNASLDDILTRLDALEEGGTGGGGNPNAVLFTPQELTDEQKAQARENIGVIQGNESSVLFAPQELTPEEQAQARENIGANSIYTLRYHEGLGWGEDGVDYDAARRAFRAGKTVVLQYTRIAGQGNEHYICTKEMTFEAEYPQDGLLFLGASHGNATELRLYPDGTFDIAVLGDTYDLEVKQEVLESQLSSLPFKALTGTTSAPIVLRTLGSGIYLLNGNVKNTFASSVANAVNDFYFVSNNGPTTYAIKMATSLHAVHMYKITDAKSEWFPCRLDQVLERLDNIEARLAALGG